MRPPIPIWRMTPLFVASLVWIGPTHAEDLTLRGDQTFIMTLAEKPSTIIVGNPNIADVSMHANTLLFLAKGFGTTNVTLLDDRGKEIRDWQVHVVRDDRYGVAVFKAGKRELLTCKVDCETLGERSHTASSGTVSPAAPQ